jgi:AcrR family transcriptional regulator
MTDKQIAILETALELFSKKGFDAVSTNLIAKKAGVSEGLIFRHFQNKMGLLQAIMQMGKEKVEPVLESIAELPDAAQRVHAIMELPFHIREEDYPFWRLIYSLKWQNEYYDDEMSKPTKDILVKALTEMQYADADAEADLIMSYVDGFSTTVLLKRDSIDTTRLLETLRKKYKQ